MVRIKSLDEYKKFIEEQRAQTSMSLGSINLLFRGHASDAYKIVPTIARNFKTVEEILKFEKNLLSLTKTKIVGNKLGSVTLNLPQSKDDFLYDWFLQFQSRHLEIPSRLIDFSMNEFTALYFCLSSLDKHGEDGHVWIYPSIKDFSIFTTKTRQLEKIESDHLHLTAGDTSKEILATINPRNPEKITLLHNSYVLDDWQAQIGERRKMAQFGKFVVKPNDTLLIPLENHMIGTMMQKLIIDGASKNKIYTELMANYNFDEERVLPEIPADTKTLIDEIISDAKNLM